MYANIQKWGNSQAIRLPKAILETAFLKENDSVQIIAEENKITIKKSMNRVHKTIKQRLEEHYKKDIDSILLEVEQNNEKPIEVDWGKPVGNEVW